MNINEIIKHKTQVITGDIFGGINSAIITLPQALAFGVATGFGASAGLWGAIILCFVAGILGPKTPLISGATGPVAIVTAATMMALHNNLSSVVSVLIMAAVFQIFIGATKLPGIVKYVPYPVISGFMNGVGIIIIILQLNPLLGHKTTSSIMNALTVLPQSVLATNRESLLIGLLTLAIVFFTPKQINKIIPSQIIALILCTLISIKTGMNLERINSISLHFPQFVMPDTNINNLLKYIPYALTISVVFSVESMLTGLVSDSITKTKHSPKRLLISQGIGNICCALTGSLGGSAATMRSVAALKSGATTKLCAVINPLLLLMMMYKCSGFVTQIPLAVLAAILIKIGYDIIDFKLLKVIKYAPKDDLYVLGLVFLLTVFYNLVFAVGSGITLASLLYAKRIADKTKLIHKPIYDKETMQFEKDVEEDYQHKIRVVHISGQFFFGSATQIISHFDEILGTEHLIINYESDDNLDISAIFALEDIIFRLQSQKINTILVIKNENILEQLNNHKISEQIGKDKIFYTEIMAIEYAKEKLKYLNGN